MDGNLISHMISPAIRTASLIDYKTLASSPAHIERFEFTQFAQLYNLCLCGVQWK